MPVVSEGLGKRPGEEVEGLRRVKESPKQWSEDSGAWKQGANQMGRSEWEWSGARGGCLPRQGRLLPSSAVLLLLWESGPSVPSLPVFPEKTDF